MLESVAAALFFAASSADAISFLKQKKIRKERAKSGFAVYVNGKPLVTQTNAFATEEEACCACFKSKYAWPANAGLGAAFAPKQTCDTCYVTDIYGIPNKAAVTMAVPRPKDDGAPAPPQCQDRCDASGAPGCEYYYQEAGTGRVTSKQYFGPGACAGWISDPTFIEQATGGKFPVCDLVGFICPSACKYNGCGGGDPAYETTDSKVMAVHEWNWNCASGNAPEDAAKWLSGPVEGEPESTRGPFKMCKEDAGWYCPFEDSPDLKLEAGTDTPVEIEEGGSTTISVSTMSLPVIDGGRTVAESTSP